MVSKRTLAVGLLGMPDKERRMVENLFALTARRTPSFALVELGDLVSADIMIVNADDEVALTAWRASGSGPTEKPATPTILAAKNKPADDTRWYMRQPLIGTRLLAMLDRIAAEALEASEPPAFSGDGVAQAAPSTDATVSSKPAGYRALVVDDSLPVRVQMKIALKSFASQVDFAETGEAAISLIENESYDIVFLDVVLPGIDGYDVCKVIKTDTSNKDTPVIMLTGNSSPADRVKGKLAGCDTYLIKPVGQAVFQEVVGEYLR